MNTKAYHPAHARRRFLVPPLHQSTGPRSAPEGGPSGFKAGASQVSVSICILDGQQKLFEDRSLLRHSARRKSLVYKAFDA